jgi:glycosyltransferase involved in cell wall biosynthesis
VFVNVAGPVAPYADPWTAGYLERRRSLVKRACRVAYIYARPDTSTFRYRIFNMVEALDAAPEQDISASWFTLDDVKRDVTLIDRADAVVICRTHFDGHIARLIARAHARGAKVIYDVDDLIFDPDYVQLIAETLDVKLVAEKDWACWFGYIARLGATLRQCDAAITTNPFLADRIRDYARIPVSVLPNFLNRQQTELSRELLTRKRTTGYARDGTVDLGYFSGTPTHNRDLLVASPAIAAVFERFPNVRLRVVGFIDLNPHLLPFTDRIQIVPLQDYLNLQRFTAEVELSIVPVQNNTFTNCKSELKYFEAGVVGVPTAASPIFTFAAAIRSGDNGYLVNSHEWEVTLAKAIALIEGDAEGYQLMCERVVEDVQGQYAWDGQAAAIRQAIFTS